MACVTATRRHPDLRLGASPRAVRQGPPVNPPVNRGSIAFHQQMGFAIEPGEEDGERLRPAEHVRAGPRAEMQVRDDEGAHAQASVDG